MAMMTEVLETMMTELVASRRMIEELKEELKVLRSAPAAESSAAALIESLVGTPPIFDKLEEFEEFCNTLFANDAKVDFVSFAKLIFWLPSFQ
jgi:hypothetical protein